ncbi:MAG: amidohydrolase family protein [Deltaproteobacteria bacterium]|nr:amidohydrolase family protein [Deltaproteobacteria bacterium]
MPGCVRRGAGPRVGPAGAARLVNCNVVDVRSGSVKRGATVCIAGGRIVTVGSDAPPPVAGEEVIDAGGRHVIPGLIDAHCHVTSSCTFRIRPTEAGRHYRQLINQLRACVRTGVTTVRDTGGFPRMLARFVDEISRGTLAGPRIVRCNSIVNVYGGHPDVPPAEMNRFAEIALLFTGKMSLWFETDSELADGLNGNVEGAAFVKLTVDDESIFCGKGRIPAYEDRHLKMIFDFAEHRGLPVVCHCMTKRGFERMAAYPVRSFEHIVSDEPITAAQAAAIAQRGTAVVPTMTICEAYMLDGWRGGFKKGPDNDFVRERLAAKRAYLAAVPEWQCDPEIHKANMAALRAYKTIGCAAAARNHKFLPKPRLFHAAATTGVDNLRTLRDAGVTIGVGMDAGTPFNYFGALHREIDILARLGMTATEVLRAATFDNARILGVADRLGAVEPGKLADLCLLDGNPLQDLSALRRPAMVFEEGRRVHPSS